MENDTVITAGIEELRLMKAKVMSMEENRAKSEIMSAEKDRLEKAVSSKEKAINDEIASTIKKRRQEIEYSFGKEEDRLKAKKKKAEAVKDKNKNKQVSERISEETAGLQEDMRRLKQEAKTLLKQNKVPILCRSQLFFVLYYPKRVRDYLILVVLMCLLFCGVPSLIMHFVSYDAEWLYPVVSLACTLIFIMLYIVLGYQAKKEHKDILSEASGIRRQMIDIEKRIKRIKKNIVNDKDESRYGLEKFNQDIQETDEALQRVLEEKRAALNQFENVTRAMISDEIKERNREEFERLKNELEAADKEFKRVDEINHKLTIEVSAKYEVFLGREALTVSFIDKMIEQIENGTAATIGEAAEAVRRAASQKEEQLN